MDSFKDVLEAAQAYCKTQMAEPTYNLYIDGLEPISFEDSSHITLSVRNDFICKIVTDRYLGLLKEAFKSVLGFDVDITLVVPSTPPHEVVLAQQYEANPASPQGNYEFTFENFIKGPSNQFAFAAAQAVAANPSGAYNPLFIYGGSGLGKTHLLTAIQTEIKRTHPDFVIMYVTCEQFTNELIAAIRAGSTEDFRMKYRVADLLLVDDIQFIAGKASTQEEFFHTFNKLYQDKKQMVFTSDRPPRDIKKLEERLRSRFENGMVTQIEPPDLETRTAILRAWAEKENITCDLDALNYIAANVSENIRKLHGAFIRVLLEASQSKSNVTLPLVKHAIHYITDAQDEKKYITIDEITTYICQHYNINYKELMGKKKTKDIALPRQIAMYMCRELTGNTYPHIGTAFNGRDHTTVMHACSQIRKKIDKDSHFKEHLEKMMNEIRGVDN